MTFTVTATNAGSRYPTDKPYTARPRCAVPSGVKAGALAFTFVTVTDRGPVNYTDSGFEQLQDAKITPNGTDPGGRTDGAYAGVRTLDGTETGFFEVEMEDGAHDWLMQVVIVSSDLGPLEVVSSDAICARLGVIAAGAAAAMDGPAGVVTADGQGLLFLGSLASTGDAYDADNPPGPNYPANITDVTLPAATDEVDRVIDDVNELSIAAFGEPGNATATYSASAIAPFTDDYFGFGFSIVIGLAPTAPPALTGLSMSIVGGTLTPHIAGAPVFDAWNPSDKSTHAALSVSNTTMTSTSTTNGVYAAARGVVPITVPTHVQGTLVTSTGDGLSLSFGAADGAVTMDDSFDPGGVLHTVGLYTNTGGAAARVYQDGSRKWDTDPTLSAMTAQTYTLDLYYDPSTRNGWLRPVGSSTFIGGGNPATGTTPTFTLGGTAQVFVCCGDDQGAIVSGKHVVYTGDPSTYTAGSSIAGFTDGLQQAGASAALTGQAMTVSAGTLTPKRSAAMTGLAVATAMGTLTPSIAPQMAGQVITITGGTLVPTIGVPLVGQALVIEQGTLSVQTAGSISGQQLTIQQGVLTPKISVPLTGMSMSVSAGAVGPAFNVPLTGLGIAAQGGQLSVGTVVAVALEGQQISVQAGQLTPAIRVPLVGLSMTVLAGHFTNAHPPPPVLVSITVTDVGAICVGATVTDL